MTDGLCLIAYGTRAETAAQKCLYSFSQFHKMAACIARSSNPGIEHLIACPPRFDPVQRSRWAKVTLPTWSPFDSTLYLDADTRVLANLSMGFDMLNDGWDIVITPSSRQGDETLWHISGDEQSETYNEFGCEPLQLQGGVFWFRRSEAVIKFFQSWQTEWLRWSRFDQGALLRALRYSPVKIHLLGRPFNGGAVVQHNFGDAS